MKVMRRIPCLFLLTFALGAAQQIPPGAGKDLFRKSLQRMPRA
jgi:hypothetical protein